MTQTLTLLAGLIVAFLVGLFTSRKTSETQAEVLDLTNKIADNKKKSVITQADADQKVKDYQDALKKYDPQFHNDDDPSGKPSA